MPLTDEQKAALTLLKSADAREFADALRAEANDHYQAIFRVGFGAAKGEYETKLQAAQAEAETLRQQVTARETELQTLRDKAPDVDAVRKDYEAKLQQKEKEKADAIAAAEQRVQDLHGSRFDAELAAQLIALKVDPDYAREVLVPKYRARRKVETDGTVKFYDDDGATPLAAADGELPRVAAERIRRSVDPKWILSGADKGGGASGGSGAAGGKGDWDKIRESAKKRHAAGGDVDALKNRRGALLPS